MEWIAASRKIRIYAKLLKELILLFTRGAESHSTHGWKCYLL